MVPEKSPKPFSHTSKAPPTLLAHPSSTNYQENIEQEDEYELNL